MLLQEPSGRQSVLDEINDSVQTPSIQSIIQLKESGRMLQAASMTFQVKKPYLFNLLHL